MTTTNPKNIKAPADQPKSITFHHRVVSNEEFVLTKEEFFKNWCKGVKKQETKEKRWNTLLEQSEEAEIVLNNAENDDVDMPPYIVEEFIENQEFSDEEEDEEEEDEE